MGQFFFTIGCYKTKATPSSPIPLTPLCFRLVFSVNCLTRHHKQNRMAGVAYCIFPSGLWETVTCQASLIPPDVSAWQRSTTNYTDPSLGLEIPVLLDRLFLGQAQTFLLSWCLQPICCSFTEFLQVLRRNNRTFASHLENHICSQDKYRDFFFNLDAPVLQCVYLLQKWLLSVFNEDFEIGLIFLFFAYYTTQNE